ncbi:hypothetical protein [Methylobacterium ajmalii]|jgi:hypothetical protein|uniref:hypothetical protein n=1 Tax=Methylobacterium ajmalii TaxID=2738439 RepID=UPI001909582A|nr:hypothetical protein [Methylobacterium ajmalii]MBK3400824.1 hypothetical protein [Methylobacterium ajmalii]MBK3412266.1 hypothetical protein [Methylobacterium ajmalii]MBK3426893.1 hypothetical protein [Methylobacterium ajmalii]MBZ6416922.1 hypothetical protein [Methylobacterium sp.]
MTRPLDAYRAGIRDTLLAAEEAAAAIRARPDAGGIRQQSAAAALEAFSAAFRCEALPEPRNAVLEALRAISDQPGEEGETPCPECAGRLRWSRAENGHVWGACEAADCLRWMM